MAAVAELASDVGTSAACQALCMPRASYYRDGRKTSAPAVSASRPSPARALRPGERDVVLACLHEERFQDRSPAAVYATLLDEGEYHCSIRTMYRLLDEHGEVRERRDQLTHPPYQKPELMATAPNQLWSWDITKLLGPRSGVISTCTSSSMCSAGMPTPRLCRLRTDGFLILDIWCGVSRSTHELHSA